MNTNDPLDVCPQCADPWCACPCALCRFVTSTPEAARERLRVGEVHNIRWTDRGCLDAADLRKRYYRALLARAALEE